MRHVHRVAGFGIAHQGLGGIRAEGFDRRQPKVVFRHRAMRRASTIFCSVGVVA